MSTSTMENSVYTLIKYSRCYPATSTGSHQGEQWQHFSNPIIQLSLTAKNGSTGNLESHHLRIVWSLGTDSHAMDTDPHQIVFEDIDLLAFPSPLNVYGVMPSAIPIKVVYRDVVVGIRYQHPLVIPQGATPTYRRIQMNFENPSSAASFINAIRLVCPCKETSRPSGAAPGCLPNRSMTLNMQGPTKPGAPGPMSQLNGINKQPNLSQTRTFIKPPGTFRQSVTKQPTQTAFGRKDDTQSQPRALVTATQPVDWDSLSSSAMAAPSDDTIESSQQVTNSSYTGQAARISHTRPAEDDISFTDDQPPLNRRRILEAHNTLPPSSLPDPSPPTSDTVVSCIDQPTTSTTERPCAPEPPLASSPDHGANILSSLQESQTIYDLPKSELESLVAHIIREDSFAKLLETVDSMWKIKSVIGVQ